MARYILKRILMMFIVLIGVTFVAFTMMYLSPGNAEEYVLGDMATEEDKELFREENGLNDPFIVQFFNYVKNALRGDLGTSYTTKQPVINEILQRFPVTLKLSLLSMLIATVIGVLLGVLSAIKQYSFVDNLCRIVAMVGVSMPNFWEGLMLIILFSVVLGILPASGLTSWKHWILPAVTIGTQSIAAIMRMTRSSMLEAIRQDYIRTARAKGQRERVITWHHAFRNAVIPVMTVIGTNFGKMMGGSAVTEMVFAIPGLGKLIVDAVSVKNAPLVQGGIIFIAFVMAFINLVVDVLYAYVDPRVRSQYVKPKREKRKGVQK